MVSKKLLMRFAALVFVLVSALHFLRVLTGVPVLISGWLLPVWVNAFGGIVTVLLSFWLWRLSGVKDV